jgi:hypothetical protein
LHLRFQLHFADHGRLTRELPHLDALIAEAEDVGVEAYRLAPPEPPADWLRLLDAVDRRLHTYRQARGAIAQAHAAAGLRDRDVSRLTSRARLVVHRYVRHFAPCLHGNCCIDRMAEIISDLEHLEQQVHPLAARLQVPSVAGEVVEMYEYLIFLRRERKAIVQAKSTADALARVAGLYTVARFADRDWQDLVAPVPPGLVRLRLVDRLVRALDRTLEGMMTLQLDAEHDAAVALAATRLVGWQEWRARVARVHAAQRPEELVEGLRHRAREVFDRWREQLQGAPAKRDRLRLVMLCDALDEVEGALTALEPRGVVPPDLLAWVRDALVAMTRSYDQVAWAQFQPTW